MSKMNKKWMYINDVNTSEKQLITGYCLTHSIPFEPSQVDTDCFLISVYIDTYEEFPSDGRLIFMFGESFEKVENKLAAKNVLML